MVDPTVIGSGMDIDGKDLDSRCRESPQNARRTGRKIQPSRRTPAIKAAATW
jgi:hypothetical protein